MTFTWGGSTSPANESYTGFVDPSFAQLSGGVTCIDEANWSTCRESRGLELMAAIKKLRLFRVAADTK